MFRLFLLLASKFGKVDSTVNGDIFVASIFGIAGAAFFAPDSEKTVTYVRGALKEAYDAAKVVEKEGLDAWLIRTSPEVLEQRMREAYNAIQYSSGWQKEEAEKMYRLIHERFAAMQKIVENASISHPV